MTHQVPKDTNGIANVLALVKPGKTKHQVVALVANRDYGVDASRGQTSYGLPSNISNMFGAGSMYKIFTSASALEKGMGINNKIDTPALYISHVYKGGGDQCPMADSVYRWYCVKNAGALPADDDAAARPGDLAEHRLRVARGPDRRGRSGGHGHPPRHARHDGEQHERPHAQPDQ